tara:strand:+ start:109 stop:264 length:156 start_codon:yes stop_codon:yes gene_type:complete
MSGPWIDSLWFMGLLEEDLKEDKKERKEKDAKTKDVPNVQSKIRHNEMAKK